jgi:hypothetical protein
MDNMAGQESRMDLIVTNSRRSLPSAATREELPVEKFNETYRAWIQVQQADFEKNGLWSDGLVAWQSEERGR